VAGPYRAEKGGGQQKKKEGQRKKKKDSPTGGTRILSGSSETIGVRSQRGKVLWKEGTCTEGLKKKANHPTTVGGNRQGKAGDPLQEKEGVQEEKTVKGNSSNEKKKERLHYAHPEVWCQGPRRLRGGEKKSGGLTKPTNPGQRQFLEKPIQSKKKG